MKEITTVPSDVQYRIEQKGKGPYQPQYKTAKGTWKNFTYMFYDQRDGDSSECNKSFQKLEEAEKYIEDHIASKTVKTFYKDDWKQWMH